MGLMGRNTYLGGHSLEGSHFARIERPALLALDRAVLDALSTLEWADFCWRAGRVPEIRKKSLRRHRNVLLVALEKLPPSVRARVDRLRLLDPDRKHLFR